MDAATPPTRSPLTCKSLAVQTLVSLMAQSGIPFAFARRILLWHSAEIGLGTLGFGFSYFLLLLWGSAPSEDPVFGAHSGLGSKEVPPRSTRGLSLRSPLLP